MSPVILALPILCALAAAEERPPVKCFEDSPERRGEEGCTILASRPLLGSLAKPAKPVYWHIDRFDSLEAAKKAAGPDGVAAEAHGSVWLVTVGAQTEGHHGGSRVASIGPLPMPAAKRYSMRVMSSLLGPGTTTPVHTHPGPEVFYVVSGEQCLETPEVGQHLGAGQSHVLPAGVVMRGRVTGSGVRRALTLVLHDAAHPASHHLENPPPLVPCKSCRATTRLTRSATAAPQLIWQRQREARARLPSRACASSGRSGSALFQRRTASAISRAASAVRPSCCATRPSARRVPA